MIDTAEPRRPERVAGLSSRRTAPAAARTPVAALAAAAAAAVVAVLLVAGSDGAREAAAPPRPEPVSALEAERRLELRFGGQSNDETAAVRCPRGIAPGRLVRCELRYPDGIPRAMLVHLSPRGELDAEVPYPATLRR